MRRRPPPDAPHEAETSPFDQHLHAAGEALPLGSAAPALSLQRSALRTLGGQFAPFGQAAAAAVQQGGEIYAALPPSAHALPDQVKKLRLLEHAKDGLLGLLGKVNAEMGATRVAIAGGVKLVEDTTAAVLQNPTTVDLVRRKAEGASKELRGLRAGLNGRRKASAQRTKALKTGFACLQAETQDELSTVKGELAKERLENQYLSGERLRPSDLGAPAQPAAAKASRRRQSR